MRRALAVVALLASLSSVLGAAEGRRVRFGHLSVEDGLSHTWVHAVLKDSRGLLWIATAAGLNRYDGARFAAYHHDAANPNSLASETVTALFEDGRKRLWVGAGGLSLYDRDRDRFDLHPLEGGAGSQGDLMIRGIREDQGGRLWITTGGGLFRYDPETRASKRYTHDPNQPGSLSTNAAVGVLCDRRGRVWVGTNAGLDRYDELSDGFIHVLQGSKIPTRLRQAAGTLYVESLYEAPDGMLWLGTLGEGLVRLDPETGTAKQYVNSPADPNSIGGNRLSAITGDSAGRIYLGVENVGLDVLDTRTERFTHHRPDIEDPASLASASVWSLLLDDQSVLWVGTYNAGLDFISPFGQRFGLVRARRGGLSNPHVMAVLEDHLGNLWIGTDGGGLSNLDRKTGRFVTYRGNPADPNSLASDTVLSLLEDRQQNIWIGTWAAGLHRLDPRTGRIERFRRAANLPTSFAEWAIHEDAQGRLLLGRYAAGVEIFDPKTGLFTPLDRIYPGVAQTATVNAIVEDRQGRLWIGGSAGVEVVDPKSGRVVSYPVDAKKPLSLAPGTVLAIRPDSRGNVWVGTEDGGLTCLEASGQKVRRYTQSDGLPHKAVGDIQEDGEGNLWLGTPRGLVKFENAVTLPGKPRFVVFDAHDGLQGFEFRHGASFKSSKGEMFFGGQRGLNSFWPKEIRENSQVPPVIFTGLEIFNKPVGIGVPGSPLEKALSETSELTLSHRQSVVTFEFAALNYLLPEKNQYKFKLDGFDEHWQEVGTRRTATYTNLSQGTYTLRVQGSNNDGVWNETGASIKIRVTPPFWWAWWFWALVVVASVAGVVAGVRWRVRLIEKRRRELETVVHQRTSDLEREVAGHRRTEARLEEENEQRRRAEDEARQYVEKLAQGNVELLAKQEALARENAERQRAEQEAVWERDLLRALMDNIPDLIYFKDVESRFVRVNAAHAKALGAASPAAVVGRSDADFFAPEFARAALADERELVRTGRAILNRQEHNARTDRWYLATKVPLRSDTGGIAGLVGISKDITERKRAEEKLDTELMAFREMIAAVASGDLTQRGCEGDEVVGQMARSINEMLAAFSAILAGARNAALSVSSASSEILAASTQISKGAQYGNEQVLSTSSAVEEIVASMAQVSRSADASAKGAQQVLEHLLRGDRSVEAAHQGMTRIDAAVTQTAERMKILEQRSGEVVEIIGLIEEIASRSTLLSLNAAIEAAHAGDAGRGFAVVAQEVRRLAERSGEATKNVAAIVEAIVAEVKVVLDAMQTAMREVKEGRALSEQARGSLSEVSTLVEGSVNLASQISSASREQVRATATVAEAMQTISNITLESSAGADGTAKAVADLVRLSDELNQAISRFRISERLG